MSNLPDDSSEEEWDQTIVDPEAMARLRRRSQAVPATETGRMQTVRTQPSAPPEPVPVPEPLPVPAPRAVPSAVPSAVPISAPMSSGNLVSPEMPPEMPAEGMSEGMADECTLVGNLPSRTSSAVALPSLPATANLEWGQPCRIHRMFLECAPPVRGVELVEPSSEGRVLRWIIGPEFRLGRSPDNADYVTWLLPRNAVHDAATRTISRCHATLQYDGGGVVVQVGDVCNGATLDGSLIPPNGAVPFRARGVLHLAGVYQCRLQWDGTACGELVVANRDDWAGRQLPAGIQGQGAVVVRPVNSQPGRWDAIWVLSGASFGSNPSAAIALPGSGLDLLQGWVVSYRGCVGILNCGRQGLVEINGHTLAPGELAFLAAGHQVRLGQSQFEVNVLA